MDFFVSQLVTISPCATNTLYALANGCSSHSHFHLGFIIPPPLSRSLAYTLSLYLALTLSFALPSGFFLLFTLMCGVKSSNKSVS